MTAETKEMQVYKPEELSQNGESEQIRSRAVFVPQTDIYETEEDVVLLVDMPGVTEDKINVTLEKNVLTLRGTSAHTAPDGYKLAFSEYRFGDYERSFRLTDEIDRDRIEAVFKNGVLTLTLPKVEEVKPRKISVKTE